LPVSQKYADIIYEVNYNWWTLYVSNYFYCYIWLEGRVWYWVWPVSDS